MSGSLAAEGATPARYARRRSCRGSRDRNRGARGGRLLRTDGASGPRASPSGSRASASALQPTEEARALAGVTRGAFLVDAREHDVCVAIDPELFPVLRVAAGVAFPPQRAARARPVHHASLVESTQQCIA